MSIVAVDKFAGPGGWDLAARALGIDPLGIEWDDAACRTREVAGLRTLQADVAALYPHQFVRDRLPGAIDLSIGSPPCPTFSNAGLREGLADLPLVYELANVIAETPDVPVEATYPDHMWSDIRSRLVVEPLRWALQLEPRWLAWEQVPPVLPFWEVCAAKLREHGWNVWTGLLSAERFGVPQTRERAFLMADRERGVHPPHPTHQRYVKGEAQRHDHTLEGEILPWVSMAEALGWDEGDEVGFPRRNDTPSNKPAADDEEEYRERDRRPASEPSFTLGEKARSWDRVLTDNTSHGAKYERDVDAPAPTLTTRTDLWKLRMGNQEKATERSSDEPAPTVLFGHRINDVEWVYNRPAPTIVGTRRSDKGIVVGRQLGEGEGRNVGGWGYERPSTTVAGDPRIAQPGHKKDADNPDSPGRMEDAVRVTLEEAAVLQSFPYDYPFQGTKSKKFEQVGNAVPPLLALAVLKELVR